LTNTQKQRIADGITFIVSLSMGAGLDYKEAQIAMIAVIELMRELDEGRDSEEMLALLIEKVIDREGERLGL